MPVEWVRIWKGWYEYQHSSKSISVWADVRGREWEVKVVRSKRKCGRAKNSTEAKVQADAAIEELLTWIKKVETDA